MAQKDAIIRSLEHKVEEQKAEIENLKEEVMGSNTGEEEKLREFEYKLIELENLVKGLTDEFLDLKSIVMKMVKVEEERTPKAPRVVRAEPPVEKKEPAKPQPAMDVREDHTALIMQADGTLKPEKRQNEGIIMASNRPNNNMSGGRSSSKRRSNEDIIIGKRRIEKRDAATPLIYAEEDDSEEIKK